MNWSDYTAWGDTPPEGGASIERRLRIPASDVWTLAAVSGALMRLTDVGYLESIGVTEPEKMSVEFFKMIIDFWGSEVSEIGLIKIHSTPNNIPGNELICNGQQYTQTEYPSLYQEYEREGIFNAGNGVFTVPDLRDKFVIGTGTRDTGDTGGSETVTLTEAQLPAHDHNAGELKITTQQTDGNSFFAVRLNGGGVNIQPRDNLISGTTATAGGGQAHDNMPPYLTLIYTVVAK